MPEERFTATSEIQLIFSLTHHMPCQHKENMETPWVTFMSSILIRVFSFALGSCVMTVAMAQFPSFCITLMSQLLTQAPPLSGFWLGGSRSTDTRWRRSGHRISTRAQLLLKLCTRFVIPLHTLAGRDECCSHSYNTPRPFEVRLYGIHTEIIIRQPQTRPLKH